MKAIKFLLRKMHVDPKYCIQFQEVPQIVSKVCIRVENLCLLFSEKAAENTEDV